MEPLQFFATLFGDSVSEERNLVIWEAVTKRSEWFTDMPSAAMRASELGKRADVYFGTCLQNRRMLKPGSRGSSAGAVTIGGIWIDIDIAGPTHQKPGLPTSEDDVRKALTSMPLSPSLVLFTGGGYHAWWALKEPYSIESESERFGIVEASTRGWQELFREQTGLTLDSTWDLARVMRIPGTLNHKNGREVQTVNWFKPASYNLSDFEQWRFTGEGEKRSIAPTLFENPGAQAPPSEKLQLMLETYPKFRLTWNRARQDLDSQSEYDYALASMTIAVGWSDQEIADMLVAHRRQLNASDPKAERPDYYRITLGKLRAEKKREDKSTDALNKAIVEVQQPQSPATHTAAQKTLSDILGFSINKIVKYPADPPVYRLETPEGEITLGGVEILLSFSKFRAKVAAATNVIMPKTVGKKWDDTLRTILAHVEVRDLGEASDPGNGISSSLREYIGGIPRISESRNEAAESYSPWVEDGHVWFFSSRFQLWLSNRSAKTSMLELAVKLRNAGAFPRTVGIKRRNGKTSTARVWGIPLERVDVNIGKQEDEATI